MLHEHMMLWEDCRREVIYGTTNYSEYYAH